MNRTNLISLCGLTLLLSTVLAWMLVITLATLGWAELFQMPAWAFGLGFLVAMFQISGHDSEIGGYFHYGLIRSPKARHWVTMFYSLAAVYYGVHLGAKLEWVLAAYLPFVGYSALLQAGISPVTYFTNKLFSEIGTAPSETIKR